MERINCLDAGYVQLIETWGSDERIVEAARMSTNKGFLGWGPKCKHCGSYNAAITRPDCGHEMEAGDERLLAYLYNNQHSTPFEMAGLVVEAKAPISVFRQWQRHRSQSYNEMSSRYTPLPDENYVPSVERLLMSSTNWSRSEWVGIFIPMAGRRKTPAQLSREIDAFLTRRLRLLGSEPWKEGRATVLRYASPFPFATKPRVSSKLRKAAKIVIVRLADLASSQSEVTSRGLAKAASGNATAEIPLVYRRADGRLHIITGDTKLAAGYCKGDDTARVRLVDVGRVAISKSSKNK